MMWMDESGRRKPVDGSRGALLKLHPDIRLNRLANWTCLLAVAPIYVHSLLQLVHLHYWNGLSSGLDRVVEMVRGGRAGEGGERTGESWIMWKINTFEAVEPAGRKGVGSVFKCPAFISLPFSPSPLRVIVCAASCQWMLMVWILSLEALSNIHAVEHKHTHARRLQLHTHKQLSALNSSSTSAAWPASQLCVVSQSRSDTLLKGRSLFLVIGCCCDFRILLQDCCIDKADERRLARVSQCETGYPIHVLLKGMCLLPDADFQFLRQSNWWPQSHFIAP